MQQSGSEQRWSTETERLLRKAGWHPGRSVPTAEWESVLQEHDEFEIHPDAQRFLAEFGGLTVTQVNVEAITVVRSETSFDPTLAKWDQEIFEVLSEQAGAELYPLGMTSNRNAYLGMTPTGTVCTGMDDAYFLAESSDQALEKLLWGARQRTEPAVPGSVGDLEMLQNGSEQRWSAKTNELLEEAGWHPGRSVSTAEWERVLQEHGRFEIHPAAQRFLAEFGGLNVTRLYVGTFTEVRAEVILDPALAKGDPEIFEVLSEEVGAELYPLGMTANRKAYLGMTPAGTVYAGMKDACFLGESGDQALDELVGQIE